MHAAKRKAKTAKNRKQILARVLRKYFIKLSKYYSMKLKLKFRRCFDNFNNFTDMISKCIESTFWPSVDNIEDL